MISFSQRIGKTPIEIPLQIDDINDDLRNGIWNGIYVCITKPIGDIAYGFAELPNQEATFLTTLWIIFFKQRLDERPTTTTQFENYIKKFVLSCKWFLLYELIEFIINNYHQTYSYNHQTEQFIYYLNDIFKKEFSGYRIIGGIISPVSSDTEVGTIRESINLSDKYKSVKVHLTAALELLSKKPTPDYRNSIKESISAVESLCAILAETPKATLGAALKIIEKNYNLHPSLKASFEKLYGYTSDADGIRHSLGLTEESNLTQADAVYMLVSCSAFVNYLIKKTIEK